MALRNFSKGGGKEKLNSSQEVKVIAGNQILIGDTVYTIQGDESQFAEPFGNDPYSICFNNDNSLLVLSGSFTGYAKIYSVSGTTVTYVSDIYADNSGTIFSATIRTATFSPDGTKLVIGGYFTGYAKLYSIEGTTVTYVSDIYADNNSTALSSNVITTTFSPDGTKLVLGGAFIGKAKIYSVSGTTVTYVSDIYADNSGTALSNWVYASAFSYDNNALVLGGAFSGYAKIYYVTGIITYISDIYANNSNTALTGNVYSFSFSPDGTKLILGGTFANRAKIYTISGTTVTYVSDIYADSNNTSLDNEVYASTFSPDGTKLVIGGYFTGYAKLYNIAGTTVTYVSDIYADNNNTALSGSVRSSAWNYNILILGGSFQYHCNTHTMKENLLTFETTLLLQPGDNILSSITRSCTFSPDGRTLILGGLFIEKAKIYSVNGTTVTYVSDIYADNSGTALSGNVYSTTFSPDGTKLIVAGAFVGYTKLYTVNGSKLTYVSDIYADNSGTALSAYGYSVSFFRDGTKFILGGNFTGFAKLYTVSGTTVTYVSNIYADNSSTALTGNVFASIFNSDGTMFILCGGFAGRAKLYIVSGTTVTYVSDIYADNSSTALSNTAYTVSFNIQGDRLFIGGGFTGRAKLYSIEGTTVTYISDLYSAINNTAVSGVVYSFAFSPDGTKFIIGGSFTGYAKLYSTLTGTLQYPVEYTKRLIGLASQQIPYSAKNIGYSPKALSIGQSGFITSIASISD